MTVYDLLIDWDGTTRSHFHSEGLYMTRELAEKARDNLNLDKRYQDWVIMPRKVIENVQS